MTADVTHDDLARGFAGLGLTERSTVIVHASLKSFGRVVGGPVAVAGALVGTGATVLMVGGTWDSTGLPAPPGLVRPNNAFWNAESWEDFDRLVSAAKPYALDLPVSRWLGAVAEALRAHPGHHRGPHPLMSFIAVGDRAAELIAAEHTDHSLGSIEKLLDFDGDVLLLGVSHTSNTTLHLAEQRLGRGHFYRYARGSDGLWLELPNVSGESHRFDDIEPHLTPAAETMIGDCHARRYRAADVMDVATTMINNDPSALLCPDPACRCGAALRQLTGAPDATL